MTSKKLPGGTRSQVLLHARRNLELEEGADLNMTCCIWQVPATCC